MDSLVVLTCIVAVKVDSIVAIIKVDTPSFITKVDVNIMLADITTLYFLVIP